MGKRLGLFLAGCLCAFGMTFAQKTVTGTVVEQETGEPVIGASVLVKGTTIGKATDRNGHFTLQNVPTSATTLRVTYTGMETKEVAIQPNLRIALESATNQLQEQIVVAYGKSTKEKFTGAASEIKSETIEDRQISNLTNALAGNVAGVTAFKANGQPGTGSTIRIRGFGSINASMNPLYVVDGMEFSGDISSIDPQDVESISVLKDAAATALYGSRAANGAILITTKSGTRNTEAKVTFEASWGSNSRQVKNYKTIGSTGQYYEQLYRTHYNNAIYNLGYSPDAAYTYANNQATNASGYQIYTVPTGEKLFTANGTINPNASIGYSDGQYYYTPDNWADESIRNGLRQEYKANISGGTDKINYYFGAGYLNDEGVIVGSAFERIATRSKIDYQVKDWLKLSTNIAYTNYKSSYPDNQTDDRSSSNVFYIINNIAPIYPMYVRNADGSYQYNQGKRVYDYGDGSSTNYTRSFHSIANPIGDLKYQTEEYLADILNTRWAVEITPVTGLTIAYRLGFDIDNTRYHYASSALYGQSASYGGEAEQEHTRDMKTTQRVEANYVHQFGGVHNLDIFASYETSDWKYEESAAYGQNLYKSGDWAVNNSIDQRRGYGYEYSDALRSWLGRVNYDYNNLYFASLSLRRDGSSRFADDNRWGTFWAASAAWDISHEKFLKSQKWIDFLKLRASFGQTGNNSLGNYYSYVDQYSMTGSDGVFSDGTLSYKGNENLKWEKTNAFDVAVDFKLWGGKLSGSIDYYNRETKDMLYYKPVASSNGYSSIPMNIGSMRNRGLELDLHSLVIDTRDLRWNIDFNLATNSNRILKLSEDLNGEYIDGSRIYTEGKSMYRYYLVKYAGVDPTTGLSLFWAKDANGNEYATTDWNAASTSNRTATGNLQPKVNGGLGTSLDFYGFDFAVQCSYQIGGKVYDNAYQSLMHSGSSSYAGHAWHKDILKAWTPENTNTDVPRIATGDLYTNATSDRWLISSNYFAINNITLGYTLPKNLTRRFFIDSVRIFGSADNVAVFSARKGMDPRLGVISTGNYTYSALRTITGGIKVTF